MTEILWSLALLLFVIVVGIRVLWRRNLTCWQCKQPVLVKNVGEERRYPGLELEYLCRTCQAETPEIDS